MRRTVTRVLLCTVFGLALGGLHAAAGSSFELMPGAVVDPGRGSILVMRPDSGIAVLDAATGRVRCATRHAARPLLLQGSRLLAQTESGGRTLRLRVLDLSYAADGSCRLAPRREVGLPLPPGVVPAIDDRIDLAFRVRAWQDGAGLARVEWTYRDSPAFPESQAAGGLVAIDLATGGTVDLDGETAPVRPATRALPPFPTETPRELRVGDGVVTIEIARRSDGTRSVALGGRKVLDAPDVRSLRIASDDRALLVSSLAPAAPRDERWVWSIYSLDGGEKRAEVRAAHSGSPFYLADSVVVYRQDGSVSRAYDKSSVARPVRLVAREVAGDGEVVWSYRVRDTAYRGVRPPRRPVAAGGRR